MPGGERAGEVGGLCHTRPGRGLRVVSNPAPSVSLRSPPPPTLAALARGGNIRSFAVVAPADRRLFGSASASYVLWWCGPEVGRQETQPTGVCSGRRPPRMSCGGVDPKSAGKKLSRPA